MRIPERWTFQRAGEVEEFRGWLADEKAGLLRGEKYLDRRCTVLGRDGWTSQGRSPREAVLPVRQHLLMCLFCDLAFVWFYRPLRLADDFFVLRCDLCDLNCSALVLVLVLVLERHPERVGELRGHHSWHRHKRRHPRQSFKPLEVNVVPSVIQLSDRPGVHTVARVQVGCLYANKVPVREVQSLGYAQ